MQKNKQNKIVSQQLQITATELRQDFSKFFDLQLKYILLIYLVIN